MKNFDIIIHVALKDNPVANVLHELGVEVKYISLRQGEFVLSPEVGIKYMTRSNYLNGIKSRSIYRDIVELKREYSRPIIIIEDDNTISVPGVDMTQIQTAVLFISVLNRIPIIFAANEIESAQLIFMMSAQVGSGLTFDSDNKTSPNKGNGEISPTTGDKRRSIIENIPEVGPGLAKALLNHFGTLSKLFAAGKKDLQKVEGIGPKRAKVIYDFFNSKSAA